MSGLDSDAVVVRNLPSLDYILLPDPKRVDSEIEGNLVCFNQLAHQKKGNLPIVFDIHYTGFGASENCESCRHRSHYHVQRGW